VLGGKRSLGLEDLISTATLIQNGIFSSNMNHQMVLALVETFCGLQVVVFFELFINRYNRNNVILASMIIKECTCTLE